MKKELSHREEKYGWLIIREGKFSYILQITLILVLSP